jgi:glycosyltransferase involved in cell wall biosynthesis
MPKVSVIIPVWNAAPYLRRCLDSVVNQTLRDIEIICVNDGSTDNSLEILNEYAAADSRIRVVSHAQNRGESAARNTALSMVRGEYIGPVDNDDYVDLDFYEKLYLKAKETGADIVKGNLLQTEYDGITKELNNNTIVRDNKINFYWGWWTAIYRHSFIFDNNITFPENLVIGGDTVFLIKAVVCSKSIETLDGAFYHYCRREESADSKILTEKKFVSYINSYKMIIDYVNRAKMWLDEYQYVCYFSICFDMYISTVLRQVAWEGGEREIKRYFAGVLLQFYNKVKDSAVKENKFAARYPCLWKLLGANDLDGITDYLVKNNIRGKLVAHELRAGILKRVKT